MKHLYTKFLFLLFVLFFSTNTFCQNSGIERSYVILDIGSGATLYDLHSVTDTTMDTGEIDFNGHSLGNFDTASGTLTLIGGQNDVWKCNSTNNITSGWLYYTIYLTGNRPGTPTFTGVDLSATIYTYSGLGCAGSGDNQEWINNAENINLLNGLPAGDYTLEVYTLADYTINGTPQTSYYVNNNANNFTATFRLDNPPTANCISTLTVQLDASGNATINATDIDAGSTDDLDTPTLSIDINSFDCSDIGSSITVTLTAEDSIGQTDTCVTTVTVEDNVNPIIAAAPANITVQCLTDVPAISDLSWTDNCDGFGYVAGVDSAFIGTGCGGTITRTWDVTDANGNNAATRTQIITIDDTTAPVIASAPANITVNCFSDVPAMIDLAWTDNCDAGGNVTGVDSALSGTSYNGTITRTWNVADACGNNAATQTQIITINDNINPVIAAAPANITVQCITDLPAITDLSWTDNCDAGGNVTGVDSALSGNSCGGTITRTWDVTDANGNNATTRTQIITIDDTTAPVIASAPANITVNCFSDVPAMIDLAWTDNCDAGGNVTGVDSALSGTSYNGTITRTWNVADACGNNAATQTQIITINDNINPVIAAAPANITVQCITDLPAITDLSWTDNCDAGGNVTGVDSALSGNSCGGTITRTWDVTDANGNNATTRTQIITIDDTTAPVIASAPANITVNCFSDVPAMIDLAWTDNCDAGGNVTGVDSALSGTSYNGTITRTWNVADACGNNAATQTQIITINDNINPVIAAAPANITVQCITDVPAITDLSWTDNCDAGGNVTGVDSALSGNSCGGTITRTWDVTDANGNNATTRTQIITIDDTTAPVIASAPANITVNCFSDVPAMIDLVWTDNCDAGGNVTGVDSALSGTSYNGTITRTWNVADACGNNAATQTQIITINDSTVPIAVCKDISITLDASGNANITAADIDNNSSDNCSSISLSASQTIFNCSNIGANTVTLTVTDASGNSASCTSTVTVIDPANAATVSISVDNTTICATEDVNFTATPMNAGPTPVYEWFVNNVSQGTTPSNVFTPFPALDDLDEVYVQMQSVYSSCDPKISNTISINVNPLPSVSGPTSLCINNSANLTPATSGWVSNTSFASVNNTGVVTGISSGIATFTYTDSNGCSSDLSITINDLPVVSAPANLCVGETSTLTPNSGGTWVSNNNSRATVTNSGVITGVAPGNVTFTYTDSNGCQSITNTVEILATPIISSLTATNTLICSGESSILTANVQGAGINNEVIVNYNFNSGGNYAALDGQEVANINCNITGHAMYFRQGPGTATQGSAYDLEIVPGYAMKQLDNDRGNDGGVWVFTIDGADISTYQDFSLYFQTKREAVIGIDKYITVYCNTIGGSPSGSASFVPISSVLIDNSATALNWQEVIVSMPDIVNNPSVIQIMIGVTDGYDGPRLATEDLHPNVYIDNVQIRASNTPDSFTYSWTANTGSDAGLPPGANIPSSANNSITVNPQVTTVYTITTHNSNGCTESEDITVTVNPAPNIVIAADYCPVDDPMTAQDESNMVQLIATDLNDSSPSTTTWEWLTTPVQTGNTIYVDTADFYQVIATSTNGCSDSGTIRVAQERVFNGDFSEAVSTVDGDFGPDANDNLNAIGFDYDEDYVAPYNAGYRYVVNPTLDQNMITITSDSGPLNTTFRSVTDHTEDTEAQFLAVNNDGTPNLVAWRQEINVEPGELYYFSAWGIDLSDPSNASLNPCDLRFRINGIEVGPTLNLVKGNDWERIYDTWNSGTETTAILEIININPAAQGNNFGIDDVSFATLSTFITLTSATGTNNQTICQNTPIQDITYDVGGGLTAPNITSTPPLPTGLTTSFDGLKFTISGTPTEFGTFNYTITTTSTCGDPKSESGTITIDEAPIVEIQPISTPICSADGSIAVNATLLGSATSGTWTTTGTGTFSNLSADGTSETYTFGINETGTTTLTFTSNTPASTCSASNDSYDIEITQTIIAEAGLDIDNSTSDCSNTTVTLNANNVAGHWTVTSGQLPSTYSFSDANVYNSTFTGESGETYTLTWEATNIAPCPNTTDTVSVIFANCDSSLVFDGTEDYISFANNYSLNNTPFSIEAWIKADNLIGTKTILSKRDSNNLDSGYDLSIINNRIYFRWNNASMYVTTPLNNSKWYHVAVTYNGSNSYLIYVDGFAVTTAAAGVVNAPLLNTNNCLIGAMDTTNGNPTHYFDGGIDEVRFWDIALTEDQIREMMNQEIMANGTFVRGVEVPLDISGGLPWNNLIGYYQMSTGSQAIVSNGYIEDIATISATQGKLNNMTTIQAETAPIPYISNTNNDWDNTATWLNGSVQQIPNSKINSHSGIEQTWNIVRTTTDVGVTRPVNMFNKTTVFGLLVDNNRLSILGDQHIVVDKYLKIDGVLDLVGESQLLQPVGSILEATSTGYLERDQQGTSNGYNYNYWGSPVKTTTSTFTLSNILYDGADGITPVYWLSAYDGIASPLSLSSRWLHIFDNGAFEDYNAWLNISQHTPINIGLGFIMKGSNTTSPNQNYTFKGLPNNGTITNFISGGNRSSLVGNPYPSAIDANAFIDDNASALLDGTLIFWEQSPNSTSHNLAQYEGRYSYYNKTGGLPSTVPVEINGQGTASNTPERYVPVAQGFFVNGSTSGGNITFNNGQRIFKTEASGESVFLRSPNVTAQQEQENEDLIKRLRMSFKTPEGAKRHLLLGFTSDNSATDAFDYGFDGLNSDDFPSDMSFNIEGKKYVIQGVGAFDETKIYPLDISMNIQGNIEIALESLENFNDEINVYIYDALLGTYSQFNNLNFQIHLEASNYLDRFYLVFQESATLSTIKEDVEKVNVRYLLDSDEILVQTPQSMELKQLYLINVAGQTVASWNATNLTLSHEIRIPVKHISEGSYIINVETNSSTFNKKIIIHQ
ncbi:Ig-like domain-containing protein [Winogradskyella eckloniae]|uniref:HYR-like domain-containing protein n=1 Tax=Winogradskyella eckloniae TaxID=1089306 RepID=UPI0015661E0A|nr:LamG-like jellyroll fold domain-containing protein [Winogradskyella eckloniae]NRD21184.1 Ig-like domain-containing protein [Winogradskyella eckloniae]